MKQSIFQIQDEIRALKDTRAYVEGQILRKEIALAVLFESLQIVQDAGGMAVAAPPASPGGSVTTEDFTRLESLSVLTAIKRVLPELNGHTFWYPDVKARVRKFWPQDSQSLRKLRYGLHPAMAYLITRGAIEKCPGGLRVKSKPEAL